MGRSKRKDYKELHEIGEKTSENVGDLDDFLCSEGEVNGAKEKEEVLDSGDETPTEEEIQVMEEQLENARRVEDRQQRKEKFKRLAKEKEELNRSIISRTIKKSSGRKKVTAASLRGMQEVVGRVDKLMDEKLEFEMSSSSSEDSSDDSSTSDATASNTSDEEDEDRKLRKKKKSKKAKKKDRKDKHKSGKNRKPTSYVKFPQDWPHSFLSLQFVSKDKKYEDLTLSEFCAGYCSILETIKSNKHLLLQQRITHFKDLMYLTATYQWKFILNYHATILLEIERGNLTWKSDFQKIQNSALAGGCLSARGNTSFRTSTSNQSTSSGGPILFCKNYQRGICSKTADHDDTDKFGEIKLFRHICAKCWLTNKKQLKHPESDDTCPSKQQL